MCIFLLGSSYEYGVEVIVSDEKETFKLGSVQQPHADYTSRNHLSPIPALSERLGRPAYAHGPVTKCRYCTATTVVSGDSQVR